MPKCGVLHRSMFTAARGKKSRINALRRNPFWRKAWVWPLENVQRFCLKNRCNMNVIEGHSYFAVGITKNPLKERGGKDDSTIDIVNYLVWMDTHSNLQYLFSVKKIEPGMILTGTINGEEMSIEVTAINDDRITGKDNQIYRIQKNNGQLDIYGKSTEEGGRTPQVIVYDLPQAETNYKHIYNLNERVAERYAIQLGREKTEAIEAIGGRLNLKISVETFESIKNTEQFQKIYSLLRELRNEDPCINRALLSLVPNSIKQSIKEWQLIREFKWDDKSKIPLSPEEKEGYFKSQNKLKDYLEPHLEVHLKEKSKKERKSIIANLRADYKGRVMGVSDYALQEVAMILAMDGVKVGHRNEKGYDDLAIYISKTYGKEYNLRNIDSNSFRYLPPSVFAKDKGASQESIEPYNVRKLENRLLIADDATTTQEKLKSIPFRRLWFTRKMLIELGADPEKINDLATIGGSIRDLMIRPIQKAQEKAKALEDRRMERLRMVIRRCGVENKTVLEIGCSKGELTIPIAKAGGKITALTPSQKDLNSLKALPESEAGEITFQSLDGRGLKEGKGLPFMDNSFDMALFSFFPHQNFPSDTKNQEMFLSEVLRVVKPNGKIAFIEPDIDSKLIGDTLYSYMKGRTVVVKGWEQKISFLVANGAIRQSKNIERIATPHYFHSVGAARIYFNKKTLFYNLKPVNSEEREKIEKGIKELHEDGDFLVLADSIKIIIAKKKGLPPEDPSLSIPSGYPK